MIKKYFPTFHYKKEGHFKWCYTDDQYLPLIQKLSEDFEKLVIEKSSSKHSHVSFPYDHTFKCQTPVFVKFQHVRHFKQKIKETLGWKHKYYGYRFGIAEALNLLKAKKAGVLCPDIYAIGEVQKGLLIDSYIVVMEYLSGYKTLSDALSEAETESVQQNLLDNTALAVTDLFQKGIFHSDFTSKNIMFAPESNSIYKVVDFEYIRFIPEPNGHMLAFLLGYLYKKWCSNFLNETLYDRWALELIQRFNGSEYSNEVQDMYQQSKTQYFSRKQIIAMVDALA